MACAHKYALIYRGAQEEGEKGAKERKEG